MKTKIQQSEEELIAAWKKFNKQNQQCINFQKMMQWSEYAFKRLDLMEFLDANTNIEGFLKRYLNQQCGVTDDRSELEFKYKQGVDFLNWMIEIHQSQRKQQNWSRNKLKQNQQQKLQKLNIIGQSQSKSKALGQKFDNQSRIDKNKSKQISKSYKSKNNSNHQDQQKMRQANELQSSEVKIIKEKSHNKSGVNKSMLRKQSDDFRQPKNRQTFTNEFQQINSNRPASNFESRANHKENQRKENDDQPKDIQAIKNENLKLYDNWQQHVRIIFEHYCKLTYATGQEHTFDLIQHKSQTMTVNKFMIFCRDFLVLRMPNMNRNLLVDIFKKHSELFKEMNLKQFNQALEKIGRNAYPQHQNQQLPNDNEQNQKECKQPSKNMSLVLKYLKIDNNANFKQMMKKVGILNYKIRVNNEQIVVKKQPINYKFKFQPAQKSANQIKKQVVERKNVHSQKKLNVKMKTDNIKQYQARLSVKPRKAYSNKKGQILPPTVPPKKLYVQKPVDQRLNNQVTGYANIHKLKKQGKMDAFRNINNGFVREVNSKNRLKLNGIVQQARLQVEQNNKKDQEKRYGDLVQSQGDARQYGNVRAIVRMRDRQGNYRQVFQADRDDVSTPYGLQSSQYSSKNLHSNNNRNGNNLIKHNHRPMPLPLNDKYQQQEDILGLIENNQQGEDQFLKEHLNREKRVDHITKRINQKIIQMNSSP